MSFVMKQDELLALVANARWFADYYVRSRYLGDGLYRVKTNYPWRQGASA
jgi:hypothetical protein